MADLLYLDPVGGVAGDMFLAAALDLGVPQVELERLLRSLDLPGWRLAPAPAEAGGVRGTHLDVLVDGPQPAERGLASILDLITRGGLPPRARDAAHRIFERIGRAEAKVHGVPLERVHFHEVGAVDSIVDACGAAAVMEILGWPRAVAGPPALGQGLVETCHGTLPVPAPAVLEILAGITVLPGGPPGEAVTPTGAAILAELFEVGAPPPYAPRRVGCGVGTSRWPDRPNVLRLILADAALSRGALQLLETNLDDASGQLVARAIEAALEQGAVDAWAVPATMKKGRPGLVLSALAPAERAQAVARTLMTETTTLGVRLRPVERIEAERAWVTVETSFGAVRVKVGRLGGEMVNARPEWDDCAARAREHGVPVKRVLEAAAAAFAKAHP